MAVSSYCPNFMSFAPNVGVNKKKFSVKENEVLISKSVSVRFRLV